MTSSPIGPPVATSLSLKLVFQTAGLIVAATVVVFGGVLALGLTVPIVRPHITTALAIAIPVHAALVLAVEGWCLKRRGLTWGELGFSRPTRRLLHLLWQTPAALIALVLVQGAALLILGDNGSSGGGGISRMAGLGPVAALLLFLGAAVLTPLWEEVFFRGILFGWVQERWRTVWAVVVSALIFAAVHGVPILLPYLVTMGFALGLLRAFHRNLWGSLALHTTINMIASSALLVALL